MIYLRLTLFAFFLAVSCDKLLSQHFHFRNLSQREGVPSSCVYRVFEDSKGYIWYVTDKGISRYDGNKGRHFGPEDGFDEAGAFHVSEAADGSIWFLANYHLYGFKKERFFRVPFSERFSWIDTDRQGRTWVLGLTGNIYSLNTSNHQITSFIESPNGKVIGAYSLMHAQNENFLLATAHGTYSVNKKTFKKLITADVYKTLMPARFFRLSDRILISDQSGMHETDLTLSIIKLQPFPELRGAGSVYEDTISKDVWIGSLRGLFHFPGGRVRRDNFQQLLPDHNVTAIRKFRDNNFWIGTLDAGVFCCNFQSVHVDHREGLPAKDSRVIKKENGSIYIFTQDLKYYKLEKNKVSAHAFPESVTGIILQATTVNDTAIYLTGSDPYWLSGGKLKKHELSFQPVKHTNKTQLIIDMEGLAWRYGTNDTIITYNMRDKLLDRDKNKKMELIKDYPLLVDDHFMYYPTKKSILKIKRGDKDLQVVSIPIKGQISDIDKFGNHLLISTLNNGVFIYGPEEIVHLDVINGLPSNFCKKIYVRENAAWIATNKGIAKLLLNKKGSVTKIINFTSGDYLINDEISDMEFDKGKVYVATAKGISIFPENTQPVCLKPVILIEKVQINSRDTTFLPEYHLSYDQNNVLIEFNSPGARSGNYNLYQGIITKNESTDTHFYTTNTLQLGSLMPGDYRIHMNVRNVDGLWNSIPSTIHIIIHPPFWKTWWFILSIISFCGGIITYVIYTHNRSLRRSTEFKMKLIQSDLRSLRLHMNPHFIFNSLTSLQSYILTNRTNEADDYISRFSSLIRSIMNYSVKGEIRLQDEVDLLRNYIELEMVRFENQFDYTISVAPDIPAKEILIPSLLIQPFVENAIKHGLTGLNRNGVLKIHFYKHPETLICTIEDNGRGRKSSSPAKRKNEEHQATGISFTMERIRLLMPQAQNNIVEITDLYENDQPSGTRLDILIPVLNDIQI